jgi:uncharacterized protein YjbI with pentapeptide repeats
MEMNKILETDPVLKTIPINKFIAYLEKTGWMKMDHPNDRIFLFQSPPIVEGEPLQLILPRNHDLEDANAYLAQALNLLGDVEQESINSIIKRIKADNLQVDRAKRKNNEDHFKIILQGIEVWNLWRGDNPEIQPDLSGANLSGANLSGVNLSEANLSGANLSKANLSGAIISGAIISGAIISGAILSSANLSGVDLHGRDFTGKDLSEVDFQNTNLQTARLINANLDGANLTGARLWEIQRAGWSIKGVICESVYWDENATEKTVYTVGEFEKLFADLTKIQLSYKGGMRLLEVATLPALIQHLANTFPDSTLRFVSIHEDSGGAVVELAIEDADALNKEQVKQLQVALEKEAQQQVEYQRKALKEREKRLELEGEVKQLSTMIDKLIQRPNFSILPQRDLPITGDRSIRYSNQGQVGAMGDSAHTEDMTLNQIINHTGESIDLVALAKELAQLRMAIAAKQDASPQAAIAIGEVAKAEIAAGDKDESKVLEHLKAAGKWTLDFAKDIGKDVVVAAIKQSMGMP